jgi:ABC-type phosphate transport system permease subunit
MENSEQEVKKPSSMYDEYLPLFDELKTLILTHAKRIWSTPSIFYGLLAVLTFFLLCFYLIGRVYMAFINLPKDEKTSNVDKVAKIIES